MARSAFSIVASARRAAYSGRDAHGPFHMTTSALTERCRPPFAGTSRGGASRSQIMKSLRLFCGTPNWEASSTCSRTWYPSASVPAMRSPKPPQLRMWITFSRTIHRGSSLRAKSSTYLAVALLRSSRPRFPLAHVWFLHSGDAMMSSMCARPSRAGSQLPFSVRLTPTPVPKFASYVLAARFHASTPQTISAPAIRAPQPLPPPPQNRSSVRTVPAPVRRVPLRSSGIASTLPTLAIRLEKGYHSDQAVVWRMPYLMFPYSNDLPAHPSQAPVVPGVATPRRVNLGLPLVGQLVAPLRKPPSVPEVSVDENGHLCITKDKIRPARQFSHMTLPGQAV